MNFIENGVLGTGIDRASSRYGFGTSKSQISGAVSGHCTPAATPNGCTALVRENEPVVARAGRTKPQAATCPAKNRREEGRNSSTPIAAMMPRCAIHSLGTR